MTRHPVRLPLGVSSGDQVPAFQTLSGYLNRFRTCSESSPIKDGSRAVASYIVLVLHISYFPSFAASFVLAGREATSPWLIGRKVRMASKAWSSSFILWIPVITTEVGGFRA